MRERRAHVTILSEDLQSEVFVRRFLIGIGLKSSTIRTSRGPSGRGAAEQFVRENYANQMRILRSKTYLNLCLIVVIDADTHQTTHRRRQLSESLASARMSDRTQQERVAILIPRRNIETWITYLKGQHVDEVTEYRKPYSGRESECQPAVDRLVDFYRSGRQLPENCPASLREAVEELNRIV